MLEAHQGASGFESQRLLRAALARLVVLRADSLQPSVSFLPEELVGSRSESGSSMHAAQQAGISTTLEGEHRATIPFV